MDPKPSGPKRNTSGYNLNYEDIGMPPRPGMIYSIFVVRCLPQMMESHHQNISRLIAEWHYQQEKGLTSKEWAEGILDRRPIEGAPREGTDLNRQGSGCPELTIPGWYPPIPEDVLIPPVVSASSGSLEEGPQQTPDHGPNQRNQHLLSVQLNTPVSRTSTQEDRWTEE